MNQDFLDVKGKPAEVNSIAKEAEKVKNSVRDSGCGRGPGRDW